MATSDTPLPPAQAPTPSQDLSELPLNALPPTWLSRARAGEATLVADAKAAYSKWNGAAAWVAAHPKTTMVIASAIILLSIIYL